jgi:cystathionine beta-lyase/cystathionine gamma-synthase
MKYDHAFETLAIHAGQSPDPATGAVMTPIYQTSTYEQSAVGEHQGFEYARTSNPTRSALEACLAALEGGSFGLAFASGMAATDTILRLLEPGDEVLAVDDLYGGTYRILKQVYEPYGIRLKVVEAHSTADLLAAVSDDTRLIWVESPTNPKMNLFDLRAIAEDLANKSPRPLFCVDNTFATPYLQQPLQLGADLVLHSTTKYLGGHSDVVGGAIIVNDQEIFERLSFLQNAVGAVPGPMDCFLVLRGIKTLPVRMDRHAANALQISEFLSAHVDVQDLRYPGHPSHPHFEVARRQMRNGGGMLSFVHRGGVDAAREFVEGTQLFTLAESLGGVESLIELPAAMTHASTADSPYAIDPTLIRLSVGIESVDDLLLDLQKAFKTE